MNEKQGLVDDVFHKVARRYDIMNDLMSGGLHRLWKDTLVAKVNARGRKGFRHLDVAGGTGDVAFRIAASAAHDAEIVVLDINGDMLEVGRDRARERGVSGKSNSCRPMPKSLPFPGRAFRRLHDRFRHSQRAAHRRRPRRSLSRAEARRPLPVP